MNDLVPLIYIGPDKIKVFKHMTLGDEYNFVREDLADGKDLVSPTMCPPDLAIELLTTMNSWGVTTMEGARARDCHLFKLGEGYTLEGEGSDESPYKITKGGF